MANVSFDNVKIKGISAVVPKNVIKNSDLVGLMTEKEIRNAIKTTGISERRIVDKNMCASDLCFEAANKLLDDMNIDRRSIDLLIFLSQTPDYHQPSTAPLLQDRLNLPKTTGAFDINMACSGYVYGLSTAFSYASQIGIDNVLLLVGETLSKVTSLKDRATSLLFGDGAAATLIEKDKRSGKSYFSLNSDGSGEEILKIPAGGFRRPSSSITIMEKRYEDGSLRTEEQFFMDGMEVFNFTMREVPVDVNNILRFSGNTLENIDYVVFHQANKFMTDFFAKKLKIPLVKVPYSMEKYGNTSGVSIPLTIVSELKHELRNNNRRLLLIGFGAGFSWAATVLDFSDTYVTDILEV